MKNFCVIIFILTSSSLLHPIESRLKCYTCNENTQVESEPEPTGRPSDVNGTTIKVPIPLEDLPTHEHVVGARNPKCSENKDILRNCSMHAKKDPVCYRFKGKTKEGEEVYSRGCLEKQIVEAACSKNELDECFMCSEDKCNGDKEMKKKTEEKKSDGKKNDTKVETKKEATSSAVMTLLDLSLIISCVIPILANLIL